MDAKTRLAALDEVVSAIAHPARRQILLTIHMVGGASTAGKIAARFSHSWPTITRHLRVLENAGLLRHERRGRSRIYHLARERLDLISDWLAWFDYIPALEASEPANEADAERQTGGAG